MTTEEQLSEVREERDEAGQELRHTLIEVSAKVEELEERLRPDRMIESSPIAAQLLPVLWAFFLAQEPILLSSGQSPLSLCSVMRSRKSFEIIKAEASKNENRSDGRETCCRRVVTPGLPPEKRRENELESVTGRRRTHAGESIQRRANHGDIARA